MKKMKTQILFVAVLLGNIAIMQAMMSRSARQLMQPGVRGFGHPTSTSLGEEELQKQGQGPRLEVLTRQDLDKLNEPEQVEYIEKIRNEVANNPWQKERVFLDSAGGTTHTAMRVKYPGDEQKQKLIEYFDKIQSLNSAYNETKREIEEEQEKTEGGFLNWLKSLFSGGSKEQ